MKSRFLAALAIVSGLTTPASAQVDSPEVQAVFEALDRGVLDPFARYPKQKRAALADALVEYYEWLNRKVPRGSPADIAWVQGEFDSGNGTRVYEVMRTPEYAKYDLGLFIDNCRRRLAEVGPAVGAHPIEEMYQWTQALHCVDDSSDFLENLQQAGYAQGTQDDWFEYGLSMWPSTKGKILDTIVLTLREEGQP